MKLWLFSVALFATVALADETADQRRDAVQPDKTKPGLEQFNDDMRVVVITEAEFVPFSQYLGLSNINTLPPSSAGNPRSAQHRTP
ncbi:MAG: hypothetical protein ACJAYE_001923 [Candidatus Azotimanducaceae bacterium]|jgi:hypothetical protein